jgi:hypothetical protein
MRLYLFLYGVCYLIQESLRQTVVPSNQCRRRLSCIYYLVEASRAFTKYVSRSIGSGNTIVEFFSAEMVFRVCGQKQQQIVLECLRSEVLISKNIKTVVLQDVIPHVLVDRYLHCVIG